MIDFCLHYKMREKLTATKSLEEKLINCFVLVLEESDALQQIYGKLPDSASKLLFKANPCIFSESFITNHTSLSAHYSFRSRGYCQSGFSAVVTSVSSNELPLPV